MYLIKTPGFIQDFFPSFTWQIPSEDRVLYLSFDDGPNPKITPWVLSQLKQYNAKATFFCIGDNVKKYPYILNKVKDAGHTVGSHTLNHVSGWATENKAYYLNVHKGARLVKSSLFRPPYGRIKRTQAKYLSDRYRIVMWDVLSGDFDQLISPQQCYENVVEYAKPGSIIVFHDSEKAQTNLFHALPRVLNHYADLGYRFERLQEKQLKSPGLKIA